MATTVYGFYNSAAPLGTYPSASHNADINAVESFFVHFGEMIPAGVVGSGDFNGAIVAGALSIDISSGAGWCGATGGRKLVALAASTRVTGLTASNTNYLFLNRDATFTANITGTPPDNAILVCTCVTSGSEVTSVDNAPTARVNLGSLFSSLRGQGYLAKSVAGSSNVTLTATEHANRVVKCTGTLTGNINLILPVTSGQWWCVWNATGGAFTLTAKTAAGTGIAIAQSSAAFVASDGTNIIRLAGDSLSVAAHATTHASTGSDIVTPGAIGALEDVLTTLGDIVVAGAAGAEGRLAIGATNQILSVIAGTAAWSFAANGYLSKSVAGNEDVTLSAAEYENKVLVFTGTLTGSINVIVPTAGGRWWLVKNSTTGAFTLTVKTAAGTGAAVTQGKSATVFCDATNIAALPGTDVITTQGDLILGGASGVPARLGIGTNGYILQSNGTTASWAAHAGQAPDTATYWTATAEGGLSAEVNLGLLTTGLLKHTVTTGVSIPATAIADTDYLTPGTAASTYAPIGAHYLTSTAETGLSAEVNLGALTTGLLLITVADGTATPSTATDIPTALTIGSAYVYRAAGTDVAILDGGTGASLAASVGGILYSGASAFAVLAGTATASQVLLSGAAAAPAWSTATYPGTTTINQLLYSSAANVIGGLATGNSGVLVTGGTGIPSIATDIPTAVTIGTAYIYRAAGTDVPLTDGGTGASTAADARTNLGVVAASLTAAGIIEVATGAETTTGTDATRCVSPDGLAGSDYGKRVVEIQVLDAATALATGDAKAYFFIPTELNGYNLVDADAAVDTVSSSGLPLIQIRNATDGHDMLSTRITIDANEKTSYTAATAPVIDTGEDDVVTGDQIAVDVDGAGTGTKGLWVILSFQLP